MVKKKLTIQRPKVNHRNSKQQVKGKSKGNLVKNGKKKQLNKKKGNFKKSKPSQDQLDKELDAYWIKGGDTEKAKSNLDLELDAYMKKAPGASK